MGRRSNFGFEKRARELKRKKKAEAKLEKKRAKAEGAKAELNPEGAAGAETAEGATTGEAEQSNVGDDGSRAEGGWAHSGGAKIVGARVPCKGPPLQRVGVPLRQGSSRPGSYSSGCGGNEAVEG
jgi:hypothetical protein